MTGPTPKARGDDRAQPDDERPRRGPGQRKKPRRITPKSLENSAMYYLQRHSATVEQLRRVLMRKVYRSVREHGGTREQHQGDIEAVLAKLVSLGLLNDQSFALHRADALRAAGRSTRVIALKLRQKGVPAALITTQVARVKLEVSDDEAAHVFARKKRLGPYRKDPATRREFRQKDLAALARAGFGYDVAKRVIDSTG